MAGSPTEDSGIGGSSNVISNGQSCQTGEALTEWRSSEQVENGTPSTSPSYWDTYDDDDCEPKPSELYGKFTWKIEKFSTINKKELRSNSFEVGGYKWYILIYPQGCDVSHHLSLFLCVANHDKLLPGWSHFAQFTIAVVNKDSKKSKYSDTLHRFWKKEHDWGWKKFMELTKVQDGFIVDDTLVIKAQVQVIREKLHRPFRCLDNQYRRELVRVYLTNVEQICRRFVEEKRAKLGKLIEDKVRWSSFCEYWLKVDKDSRIHMSREKADVILKVVVKHFFIEKEVTSTLVMDSLYSGLKALTQETADPIICVEKDMFILAGDVISLLERASVEPLPPKDEKGPQNRTKDGNSGEECNKDSIEPDERRLTELGRRSVEIFVLSHIFSNKIEISYQNAIALEKQEELIREEANSKTGRAENEQKSRRGATEKEKRAKKKQSKQRRSSRKTKDKGKDEKFDVDVQENKPNGSVVVVGTNDGASVIQVLTMHENPEALDDVSDVSFNGDDTIEALHPDVEDRYASPLTSDTESSEVHQIDAIEAQPSIEVSSSGISSLPTQNRRAGSTTNSVMDDSSSTCSTDSIPSEPVNGSYKGNSMPSYKSQMSPKRGKKQQAKERHDQTSSSPDLDSRTLEPVLDVARLHDASGICRAAEPELEVDDLSKKDQAERLEPNMDQKVEHEIVSPQKKLIVNDLIDDKPFSKQMQEASSSPARNSIVQSKSMGQSAAAAELTDETSSKKDQEPEKKVSVNILSQAPGLSKLDARKSATLSKPGLALQEKAITHVVSGMSVPSSTPIIPAPRPRSPIISMAQATPLLSRSVSATGRLGPDSSAVTHSYAPSYRNAIMGKTLGGYPTGFTPYPSSSSISPSPAYLQPLSSSLSSPMHSPQRSAGNDQSLVRPGFTFGSVSPEVLQNRHQWLDYPQLDSNVFLHPSELNGNHNLDFYGSPSRVSPTYFADDFPASVSGRASTRQAPGVVPEEFPHLDIINYLLDEEHSVGKPRMASSASSSYNMHDHPPQHSYNRQFSLPREVAMSSDASSMNYCRFDSLDNMLGNGMQPFYGSSGGAYNGLRDAVPMVGQQQVYGNGHLDGITQNHWPYGSAADISLFNIRNNEGDGYSYRLPEYSNLVNGVNGYTSYRPSNGR